MFMNKLKTLHSVFRSMSTAKKFSTDGLCTPPVTAFKSNGALDLDIVKPYVQHMLDFGVPNAFVTGTNGEGNQLSVPERKLVAEKWMQEGKGRLSKIIIHIGTGNLVESQELAKHAEEIGADAIACVGTTYYKPETFDTYLQYMQAVSNAAPKTPFILYDIDFFTGITYDSTEFFTRGKKMIPMLAGIKHTSPDIVSINRVHLTHPDMELLLGSDEMYLEALSLGVRGNIVSSFMGNTLNRLRSAFDRGDLEAARLEQTRCLQVGAIKKRHNLSITGGTKAILRAMGMEVGNPRLPMKEVSQSTVDEMKKELEEIGFFKWAFEK